MLQTPSFHISETQDSCFQYSDVRGTGSDRASPLFPLAYCMFGQFRSAGEARRSPKALLETSVGKSVTRRQLPRPRLPPGLNPAYAFKMVFIIAVEAQIPLIFGWPSPTPDLLISSPACACCKASSPSSLPRMLMKHSKCLFDRSVFSRMPRMRAVLALALALLSLLSVRGVMVGGKREVPAEDDGVKQAAEVGSELSQEAAQYPVSPPSGICRCAVRHQALGERGRGDVL